MNKKFSFRAKLLGTSAIAAGSLMFSFGSAVAIPATPNCTGLPPVDGGKIVCSGTSYYSLQSNADNLTVTLNPSAKLEYGYGPTVVLDGDKNKLILNTNSSIHNYGGNYAVVSDGDGSAVTLNNGSEIFLHGSGTGNGKYMSAILAGDNTTLTLNGGSSLKVEGGSSTGTAKYLGLVSVGSNQTIALNNGSSIDVTGTATSSSHNKYFGAMMVDYGGSSTSPSTFTLNGGSSVNVHGSAGADHAYFFGVFTTMSSAYGSGATVTLNGGSSVNLGGAGGSGNKYWAVIGGGMSGKITLNGGSSVNIIGGGTGNNKYLGIGAIDTNDAKPGTVQVTLNGGSSVNIQGSGAGDSKYLGALLFGTGSSNKYAPHMTLNGGSSINVTGSGVGQGKYGGAMLFGNSGAIVLNDSSIKVESDGGFDSYNIGIVTSGTSNVVTLNGHSSITVGAPGTKYAIGIGSNGSYGAVTLNGSSSVVVYGFGAGSAGIGIAGGYGNTLTLNDHASVWSDYSPAIDVYNTSHTTIALNGQSSVSSRYGDAIVVRDSNNLSLSLSGASSVFSRYGAGVLLESVDNSLVSVGKGTMVSGVRGIYADSNSYDNHVVVAGSVYGSSGTAIDLSNAHYNTVTLNTGADIVGDVVANGDAGDFLVLEGHGTTSNLFSGFDNLIVDADGIWKFNSDLDLTNAGGGSVTINSGTLAMNGVLHASNVDIYAGGTLGGSGTIYGNVFNYGTVSPGNSPGTLNIVGSFSFAAGSTFIAQANSTAMDLLAVSGAPGTVTINGGTVLPEFLDGVDGFYGDIITATGGVTGTFSGIGGGAALFYTNPNAVGMVAVSPASVNGGLSGGASTGFTFLDSVLGQAGNEIGRNKGLWANGLWQSANRNADGTVRGFDQHSQGGVIGGDILQSGGFTLGLAAGYIDSTVTTVGGGTRTEIDGYNGAVYGSWNMDGTFFAGVVNGAWQSQDVKRNVLSAGTVVAAHGSPDAWLGGAGLAVGHAFPIQQGWTITPKASLAWQHMERDGYTETGGGLGGVTVGDVSSDTVRGLVGAELGLTIRDPNASWIVRPSLRAGLAQEWRSGDDTVNGTFNTSGVGFTASLDQRNQTYMAVGAGVDVTIGNGVTAFASYDGGFGGDVEKTGGVRVGARLEW